MTQQPEPSRIVEDSAIRILDELAVEGGRATRAHLFDACQVKLWGHVVNVAARRAGYSGHDETEVARHGKDQLFVEAMNLLLEREQIVVWDEEGKVIALHPTHRDDYIPGTNLWRSQRRVMLDELRTQLLHFRDGKLIGDQSFEATLRKAGVLYAQQLRRGQLAGAAREEAIADMLALADVLFDPTRLAELFGIDESEVRAAALRRYQPSSSTTPPKRRQARQKSRESELEGGESVATSGESSPVSGESSTIGGESESGLRPVQLASAAEMKTERLVRGLTQTQVADHLGVSEKTLSNWERLYRGIEAWQLQAVSEFLSRHPVVNGRT